MTRVLTLAMIPALQCDWGRRISTPGHNTPCPWQAIQRVCLHAVPRRVVQVCEIHLKIVVAETLPPSRSCEGERGP